MDSAWSDLTLDTSTSAWVWSGTGFVQSTAPGSGWMSNKPGNNNSPGCAFFTETHLLMDSRCNRKRNALCVTNVKKYLTSAP